MLILNAGYAIHDGDWNFSRVSSPFARIYYVDEGEAVVTTQSGRHILSPAHMYLIPPFTEHSDFCAGEFRHFYIHVCGGRPGDENLMERFDFPFEIPSQPFDRALFQFLCSGDASMALQHADPRIYDNENSLIECVRSSRSRPLADRMESEGIVMQILGRFVRRATVKYQTTDRRIRRIIELIASRTNEAMKVDELAASACMSTDHFIRLFKSELGLTPMQFVIDRKMTRAKLMLASEAMSVKEIACSLGYDDPSYFTRLFKKHVGMSPKSYRYRYNGCGPSDKRW